MREEFKGYLQAGPLGTNEASDAIFVSLPSKLSDCSTPLHTTRQWLTSFAHKLGSQNTFLSRRILQILIDQSNDPEIKLTLDSAYRQGKTCLDPDQIAPI